jgi:hypothetical protein
MECAYYFVDGTWNLPTTLTLSAVSAHDVASETKSFELRNSHGVRLVL